LPSAEKVSGGAVVAADHSEPAGEVVECVGVDVTDGGTDGVGGVVAQLVVVPVRRGHAHDREIEVPGRGQVVERGEQLLAGQVAGGSEQHERVGATRAHDRPLAWR